MQKLVYVFSLVSNMVDSLHRQNNSNERISFHFIIIIIIMDFIRCFYSRFIVLS